MNSITRATCAIAFTIALFLAGCASGGYAESPSEKHIEIFRDRDRPTTEFKEIGLIADNGTLGEQAFIEAKFLRKARKAGADAIIVQRVTEPGRLNRSRPDDSYLFTATLVVYGH
jgi:hypothetical protein